MIWELLLKTLIPVSRIFDNKDDIFKLCRNVKNQVPAVKTSCKRNINLKSYPSCPIQSILSYNILSYPLCSGLSYTFYPLLSDLSCFIRPFVLNQSYLALSFQSCLISHIPSDQSYPALFLRSCPFSPIQLYSTYPVISVPSVLFYPWIKYLWSFLS